MATTLLTAATDLHAHTSTYCDLKTVSQQRDQIAGSVNVSPTVEAMRGRALCSDDDGGARGYMDTRHMPLQCIDSRNTTTSL